jgi:hypothetical protein
LTPVFICAPEGARSKGDHKGRPYIVRQAFEREKCMAADKGAIGAVVDEMYAMISGPAGARDWSRQLEIFHPNARQMRTGVDQGGRAWIKIMSPHEYREDVTPFFAGASFYEIEIARRIDVLGNVAHVWSVYEARRDLGDVAPERRGANSIQLFREDGRWRIVSMIWDNERPGVAIDPF